MLNQKKNEMKEKKKLNKIRKTLECEVEVMYVRARATFLSEEDYRGRRERCV